MSALEERRQRAREAGRDAACVHLIDGACELGIDEAVETATRVRITGEALMAMNPATGHREARLRAALEALGFEVEE
jgi:hypothetical protein